MELNQIINMDDYKQAWKYALQHNYIVKEIEPNEQGRRFQIVEIPASTEEKILNNLRNRRDTECFVYINRGVLWYNTLTSEQQQELNIWYQAWLDVPQVYQETKPNEIETIIPTKPSWLK